MRERTKDWDDLIRSVLATEADEIVVSPVDLWPRINSRMRKMQPLSRKRPQGFIIQSALVVLGILTVMFVYNRFFPAPPATAEEILDQTASASARMIDPGEILYERFSIAIPQNIPVPTQTATAELWRSFNGERIRFEVVRSDGKLVMFSMRNGDRLWQSLHLTTPVESEVNAILYVPEAGEGVFYPRTPYGVIGQQEIRSPFRKGVLYALPEIDQLILAHRSACAGIACLLQSLVEEHGGLELRLREEGGESAAIHIIDLIEPNGPVTFGTLKIEAEGLKFLEYTDRQGSVIHLREQKVLPELDFPRDLFSKPPEGIRILQIPEGWDADAPLREGESDRVWVISTDPEPGALIGDVLEVTLGYELRSRLVSFVIAILYPDFAYCEEHSLECGVGPPAGDQAVIVGGTGEVTLRMPLESWHARGPMVLIGAIGTTSELRLFDGYYWEVR